jgi:hypothetical protein
MYDQRLSNRENHRQLEGVSAPPAINIRVHRNEGNMPLEIIPCSCSEIAVLLAYEQAAHLDAAWILPNCAEGSGATT